MTSSLPRKCSTTELQQQLTSLPAPCLPPAGRVGVGFSFSQSGRRDSNPRPSAWKANALSTELLPQFLWAVMDSNHRRRSQLSYSQPHLATLVTAQNIFFKTKKHACFFVEPLVGFEPTTPRLQITCSGQLS